MSPTHRYRTIDVAVSGGRMRVGVWDPVEPEAASGTVLAIHGVTSSHLAWPFVVGELPGVRVVAPDLRGRGASNGLIGPAGLRAHAADLVAVLDAVEVTSVPVLGHSMGAFVAVVLAHLHPDRVSSLTLIDGGLPLDVAAGLAPDAVVATVLGPTAQRLSQRWSGPEEYAAGFWRAHPAFAADWSDELEAYIAYDLTPDGGCFRPATSYQTTVDDTVDLVSGDILPAALSQLRAPAVFLTVPRGLQNETPGLYAPAHRDRLLERYPGIEHVELDDLNHYTVVMSARGAAAVSPYLRRCRSH